MAEVFALNNLLASLLLLFGFLWARQPERTPLLWLFMFAFGLSLCNQQTIVLFVPAFVVLAGRGWVTLTGGGRVAPLRLGRSFGIAVAAFVAGLLPLLYLPLAAATNPAMDWGDPSSFGAFKRLVLREDYGTGTLVAGGKRGSIAENMRLLFGSLTSGFVVAGVLLALLGLWWAWRRRRVEGIALVTAFVVAGPLFMAYTDTSYPDELDKGIVARFYILPSIPLAIAAGLGAWWLLEKAAPVRLVQPGLVAAIGLGGAAARSVRLGRCTTTRSTTSPAITSPRATRTTSWAHCRRTPCS